MLAMGFACFGPGVKELSIFPGSALHMSRIAHHSSMLLLEMPEGRTFIAGGHSSLKLLIFL